MSLIINALPDLIQLTYTVLCRLSYYEYLATLNVRPGLVMLFGSIDRIIPPAVSTALRRGQLSQVEIWNVKEYAKMRIIQYLMTLGETYETAEMIYAGKNEERLQVLLHSASRLG